MFGNFNNKRNSLVNFEIDNAKPALVNKYAISLEEDSEDNPTSKITMFVSVGDLVQIRDGITRIIE